MTLYITLASCAFLAGWLVYRYDMYEREPWYMVLLAVGLGAGAMIVIGHVELFTLNRLDEHTIVRIAAIAATHEEGIRLLVVVGLALFIPSQFNDPMDGIIYGSLVGLGMALDESVAFLAGTEEAAVLPRSEVIRLLGHLVLGGITGFGVGMFRMRMAGWLAASIGCISFSMLMHFLWDVIALRSEELGHSPPLVTMASVALIVGGMVFYGFLVVLASEWSRRVFAPDEDHRLWGWPFTLIMKKREGGERPP